MSWFSERWRDSQTVRASADAVSHVLLVSLDGFHDFDLTDLIQNHPASAVAGSPVSTGVYYDVSCDDNLSPAGSGCSVRGTTVSYNEAIRSTA